MSSFIPIGARRNVWYAVADTNPIGSGVDPTNSPVRLALTPGIPPIEADWIVGAWEDGTVEIDDRLWYLARAEVGPGTGRVYAKGYYNLYIEIDFNGVKDIAKGAVIQFIE